jgi:hypothetical protein
MLTNKTKPRTMTNKKKPSKQELLNTPMNMLGLGGAFDNWFFNQKEMQQSEVITLKEFIELNPGLKIGTDTLICTNTPEKLGYRSGFNKSRTSWGKIKNFLIKNKFTHKDWIMLLPEKIENGKKVNDYAKMSKDDLLLMPICAITNVKPYSWPFKRTVKAITESISPEKCIVNVLIDWSISELEKEVTGPSVRPTLHSIQQKLFAYGFTKKDGKFMQSRFGKIETKQDYIDELIANKSFSKKDAMRATDLAIKAGWIKPQSN